MVQTNPSRNTDDKASTASMIPHYDAEIDRPFSRTPVRRPPWVKDDSSDSEDEDLTDSGAMAPGEGGHQSETREGFDLFEPSPGPSRTLATEVPADDLLDRLHPSLSRKKEPNPNDVEQGVVMGETVNETILRLSNEFMPVNESHADTLIYIGAPPRSARQDDYEYANIRKHFEKPYLMRSSTLKALDSSKFNTFLGPMSARTERKLKKLGVHKSVLEPEKIKYYIDLRPAIEEEEGLILLTELTSTPGVLGWHRHASRYEIDYSLVAGSDELNLPPKPRYEYSMYDETTPESDAKPEGQASPSKRRKKSNVDEDAPEWLRSKNKVEELSHRPIGEDYSPLRHHSAIERLLHAIAGDDPKLNSAPKAWTYCAVAKYFDCATNPRINEWITSWLLASTNANFIQANPEVVYRMALAMKSPGLLRCAFAILVGERALQKARSEMQPALDSPRRTVHGRIKSDMDDDELNRIDHAVPSLIYRAKDVFERLTEWSMSWTLLSLERQQLNEIEADNDYERALILRAKSSLNSFIRRRVLYVMFERLYIKNKTHRSNTDKDISTIDVYEGLDGSLRLLTQSFWMNMSDMGFYTENEGAEELGDWDSQLAYLQTQGAVSKDDFLPFVSKYWLFHAFDELNSMITSKYFAKQKTLGKLPSRSQDDSRKPGQQYDEYGRPMRGPETYSQPLPSRGPDTYSLPLPVRERRQNMQTAQPQPEELPKYQPILMDHQTMQASIHRVGEDEKETWSSRIEELDEPEELFPIHWDAEEEEAADQTLCKTPTAQAQIPQAQIPDMELLQPREPGLPLDGKDRTQEAATIDEIGDNANEPTEEPKQNFEHFRKANFFHNDRTRELRLVSLPQILSELTVEMRNIVENTMVVPGYVLDMTCEWEIPIHENDTLLCLTDEEWKYLPLWAGGLDDGTGGVFDDGVEVPDAPDVDAGGFRGGVMGLISASNSDAGSMAGSEFEEIMTEVGISTVGKASRIATDGTAGGSTVMSLDE